MEDPEQCLELMRRGESNRIVRQTHMNAKSSRSHTIFTLLIEEVFPSKKSYRVLVYPYAENEDKPLRSRRIIEDSQGRNNDWRAFLGNEEYQLITDYAWQGHWCTCNRQRHSAISIV